jgi:hypothetical protein
MRVMVTGILFLFSYLTMALRRAYVAQKPTHVLRPQYSSREFLESKRMMVAPPSEEDPESYLRETSRKPLFPSRVTLPKSSKVIKSSGVVDPFSDSSSSSKKEKSKDDSNMLSVIMMSLRSLFSAKEWKSDSMRPSRMVKGKVDPASGGMEPFKKAARASEWLNRDKK